MLRWQSESDLLTTERLILVALSVFKWSIKLQDYLILARRKRLNNLLLIIVSGLMISLKQKRMGILNPLELNMLIKKESMNLSGSSYWIMPGKDIIVVCLLMGKLAQGNHTLWLDMELIVGLYLFPAKEYFRRLDLIRIKTNSSKFKFQWWKFTMRESKIY